MNEALLKQAQRLANRGYLVEYEMDTLPNGQIAIMASNPNLPGCMAQGATVDEATENLNAARVDYIYALLDAGTSVPEPHLPMAARTSGPGDEATTTETFLVESNMSNVLNWAIKSEHSKHTFSFSLGGDLVKHSK